MLSDKEKEGIQLILQKMTAEDILSLADTMTNNMVQMQSVHEACTSVLAYAENAMDVLRRKKVKKEYIFQYLHEVGAAVSPNMDKKATIYAVLRHWDSQMAIGFDTNMIQIEEDTMMCDEPQSNIGSASSNNDQSEVYQMAVQFVRWFYPLFNNGHVSNPNAEDNFGPHHFWRDCKLKIHTPQYEHLVEGSIPVCQKLLTLIGQHQLYFNPFDADQGIRSFVDPHGAVMIFVGGVLHHMDTCIGMFEQAFGLMRDPACDNKWKIKFTEVKLAGKDLDINPLDCSAICYS